MEDFVGLLLIGFIIFNGLTGLGFSAFLVVLFGIIVYGLVNL